MPSYAQGGPDKPREGHREQGRRSLCNVSVTCSIAWVWFLIVSVSGCSLVVGSLWNVSVCFFMGVCRLLGRLLRVLIRWFRPILFYSILFYSILPYPILFLLYSILFYSAIFGYMIVPSSGRDASLVFKGLIFNTQALG